MQQKTLISLGALLAIGVLAWLTLRAPQKGQRVGPPPRPIAAFKAADVKELEISSDHGKNHVVLKLDGAAWQVTQPQAWRADQSLVKNAVDQLEKVSFGDLVTENTAKLGELEVSDDKGAHVIARGAGPGNSVLFDAWLGKAGGSGFTMLRPAGKNEVWQASGVQKYAFAREVKMWRDHTITEFNRDDLGKLAVEADGQKVVLERITQTAEERKANKEPTWRVASSTVKVDPLDDSVPNGILNAMVSLRAADFDDGAKAADVGLAPPRIKITATVKGQDTVLLVGNSKGDDNWLAIEGKPQIFLAQKYLVERLAQKPANFRDKTVVKAKQGDLVEIDVATGDSSMVLKHDGDKWTVQGKADADEGKVKGIAAAFDNLAGTSFSDTADPKVTGMAKPTGTVTLKLRDKSQVAVKIGAVKDGTDYYVQRVGSPDVVMVKKWAADRFLKKPADLTKAATPQAPPGGMQIPGMH